MPSSAHRMLPSDCSPFDPKMPPNYGYTPTLAAGIIFSIIFGVSTLVHVWQTYTSRKIWQIAFALGALTEMLGWAARAAASRCVYSSTFFEMQISTLIFAPAWTTAGVYITLAVLIPIVGQEKSALPPRVYFYIFTSIDFVSLLLQAIGGGMASAADDDDALKLGTDVMLSGILFQLASIVVFSVLFCLVIIKSLGTVKSSRPLVLLITGLTICVSCMLARGVFRSIELLGGWRGYLITTERYFIALGGSLMALAVIILNVLNPGLLLIKARKEKEEQSEEKEVVESSSDEGVVRRGLGA